MIIYRVERLEARITKQIETDVDSPEGLEYHEISRLAWIVDPEGNKIEFC